jgi:hypothetical protein
VNPGVILKGSEDSIRIRYGFVDLWPRSSPSFEGCFKETKKQIYNEEFDPGSG